MTDHHLVDDADDQRRRPNVMQQNPDGSWVPATPLGWLEEHSRFGCWVLALRGLDHCGRQVTTTDRILAVGIGLGWLGLVVPLVLMLARALS